MTTETLYQIYLSCAVVSTDTRNITPGSLFFALKGANFNGNAFAAQALTKGASHAVVDEAAFATDERFLLVDDVLKTLQNLARHHRRQLSVPVIAMTGSNGKTTTKELIHRVLSAKYKTYSTRGNLNNYIGLPLTLLSVGREIEMVVLEMGSNRLGDIEELAGICEPTHGLITNIGKAHLEGFGGFEGVKKGEGELYDYFVRHGGTVFANAQNPVLQQMLADRQLSAIGYPPVGCELTESAPNVVYRDAAGHITETNLPGRHNFENIAAALCIGQHFGVPAVQANAAAGGYVPENNRSQTIEKGTNTILLDAYNANPTSMLASLDYFAALPAGRKVVILGDMAELGEYAAGEHRTIGAMTARAGFDKVLLCGPLMQNAVAPNPDAYYFIDKFSLNNWLTDNKLENSHILIKGSRRMALETLVELL